MIIILTLLCTACGKGDKKDNATTSDDAINQNAEYVSLFGCDTVTELKKIAKEKNIELFESEDKRYLGVSQHKEGELLIDIAAMIDGDNIKNMKASITFGKDYSKLTDKVSQLKQDMDYTTLVYANLFGFGIVSYDFKAFYNDGRILDQNTDEFYESIVKKDAHILSVIKFDDKSYWDIKGSIEEEERFVLRLERIFENLDDSLADIILE